MFHVPEKFRLRTGECATTERAGNNGAFIIPACNAAGRPFALRTIASDGYGWEHVSVSLRVLRCPTWNEMCFVKSLFWDDEDCVISISPAARRVRQHAQVLLALVASDWFRCDCAALDFGGRMSQTEPLSMWTIYDHPTDFPNHFVARRFEVSRDVCATDDVIAMIELEALREKMQVRGLYCLPRSEHDDPCIVETWF